MAINLLSPPKSKKELSEQMNISRQSLYYKPKLPEKDQILKTMIEKVMEKHKAYGHKRIAYELKINKKRILRVMKLFNLKPKRNRKAPRKPKDENQPSTGIPNLIKGMLVLTRGLVWVSDFTFLLYYGRFVYLATLEDIFTREIVGWEVSLRHDKHLVAQALLNALDKNSAPEISHSDQGSENRSGHYLNLLESFGIKVSMSAKGSPWENGYKEGFYSEFKLELGHPEAYPSLGELVEAIALQIHYYNNERIHTALKCPPAVFAKRVKLSEQTKKGLLWRKPLENDSFKCPTTNISMSCDAFHRVGRDNKLINNYSEKTNAQSV